MQYRPSQFETEYLKRMRDKKAENLGISPGKTNMHIAAIPWEVDQEMVKKHGPTWYQNHKVFMRFLKEHPMYCVAAKTKKQLNKVARHLQLGGVT